MWEVWKARNVSIFSNILQKDEVIYLNILTLFYEWSKYSLVRRRIYYSFPTLLQEHLVGYFDGATLNGACGVAQLLSLIQIK